MFTPQQLDEISFSRGRFHGYDIDSVDAVLEPLIEDYTTLYKENALLKSKLRVLVEKLEEYRGNEAGLRESMLQTQKTCDQMLLDAEARCAQMLADANAAVAQRQEEAGALIAAEDRRIEEAKRLTFERIGDILGQLDLCGKLLQELRTREQPRDTGRLRNTAANAVAQEISQNLEAMVGTTEELPRKAP